MTSRQLDPRRETLGRVKWPDPKTGPWTIEIIWRLQAGVPTPVALSILGLYGAGVPAAVTSPRLDSRVLRRLPFGALARDTLQHARTHVASSSAFYKTFETDFPDAAAKHGAPERRQALATLGEGLGSSGRRGRDLGDDHYRQVAAIYRANAGPGGKPTKAVQERFVLSKSAAAKQVAAARARGFLAPSTGRGRAGVAEVEQ